MYKRQGFTLSGHSNKSGSRNTSVVWRRTRQRVEGRAHRIDGDLVAEIKAYHIAKWESSTLLPSFVNHRKVVSEINAMAIMERDSSV